MSEEEIKNYIKNKAWEYRWGLQNLDMSEEEKHRMRAKADVLFDLLIYIDKG